MSYRSGRFWQPDVTVATVVVRDGRLLVVEEQVRGERVLNQPAGHLEPDESLAEAALRETLEETGWEVALTAFIGAYQWTSPRDGKHFLRMAFAAEPLRHHPERPLDDGIVQALWLTPAELAAESARHRSAAERLQLALQQLRRERGETLPGGAWRLRASQAELAQLAGVTRQTANEWLRASGIELGYRQLGGTG